MRRWVCPNGCAGVNAPDKPRTDDVRRYCLPCSEKTGRLVRRTCPALDRKREAGKTRSAEKAKAKRVKAKAARMYRGIDIDAEAKRMWNLPAMREAHGGRRRVPQVDIRRRKYGYNTGHAWWSRVTVTFGGDAASALATLLHELAHATGAGYWHDDAWAALFIAAARERWGAEHFQFRVPSSGAQYLSGKIADGIRDAMSEKEVAA